MFLTRSPVTCPLFSVLTVGESPRLFSGRLGQVARETNKGRPLLLRKTTDERYIRAKTRCRGDVTPFFIPRGLSFRIVNKRGTI